MTQSPRHFGGPGQPNRRDFVRHVAAAAAGVLVGGDLATTVGAFQPAGRRRVMVGGRPVKTVDLHCHVVVPGAAALMGRGGAQNNPGGRGGAGNQNGRGGAQNSNNDRQAIAPEPMRLRLQAMDQQGIDVQAVSINPNWYGLERELSRQLIAVQNEELAKLHDVYPDRFVALASVALQHPDLAAEQLEEAVRKFGMRGAAIGGSVEGEELSSPRFDPFWARAEALNALIFIHPQNAPGRPTTRLQGNGVLANVIGNPLETTIALSHLIFEGTLDRFPGLRICAAHGGGYLPSYSARSDHGCLVFPEQCTENPQETAQ